MAKILDGKQLSKQIREEIRAAVEKFREECGAPPGLATVLVGDDPGSQVYVNSKKKTCAKLGMKSISHQLGADIAEHSLLKLIDQLNQDDTVDGILVQAPLPGGIDEDRVFRSILPEKDVDAFHPENVGLILRGRPRFLPCTPMGIQVMLERAGIETEGKHAVIIGRSNIVGKPLAAILMQKAAGANATVTVCHSRTANLPEITRQADILISAIGRPEFVKADMVKEGAVVIDVGINAVGVTESGKRKLVGDVAFDEVQEKASYISPVPGGVGPMTIAMLMLNTLKAAQMRRGAAHPTAVAFAGDMAADEGGPEEP